MTLHGQLTGSKTSQLTYFMQDLLDSPWFEALLVLQPSLGPKCSWAQVGRPHGPRSQASTLRLCLPAQACGSGRLSRKVSGDRFRPIFLPA